MFACQVVLSHETIGHLRKICYNIGIGLMIINPNTGVQLLDRISVGKPFLQRQF